MSGREVNSSTFHPNQQVQRFSGRTSPLVPDEEARGKSRPGNMLPGIKTMLSVNEGAPHITREMYGVPHKEIISYLPEGSFLQTIQVRTPDTEQLLKEYIRTWRQILKALEQRKDNGGVIFISRDNKERNLTSKRQLYMATTIETLHRLGFRDAYH